MPTTTPDINKVSSTLDQETQGRLQAAIQAGADPQLALKGAVQYQSKKNISNLDQESSQLTAEHDKYDKSFLGHKSLGYTLFNPESNANVTKLAAIASAIPTAGLGLVPAAIGTAAVTGGAEIGRQIGNNEHIDPLKAIEEGVKSGGANLVTGGLLEGAEKVVTNAIGDESSALGKIGNNLRKSVTNPSVKASPYGATIEDEISSTLDSLGIKGSPEAKYAQLPKVMDDLSGQVKSTLAASDKAVNAASLKEQLINSVKKAPDYTEIGSEGKRFQEAIQKITEKVDKYGDHLSPSDLYALRKEVATDAGKGFDKIAPGGQGDLKPNEAANLSAWNTLKSKLGEVVPEANDLIQKESALYQAAPGLKAARGGKGPTLEVLGTKVTVPNNVYQAGKDKVGGVLQMVGRGTKALGEQLPSLKHLAAPGIDTAIHAGVQDIANQSAPEQGGQPTPGDVLGKLTGTQGPSNMQDPTQANSNSPYTLAQLKAGMAHDIQYYNGAHQPLFQKLIDTYYPKVNTGVQTGLISVQNASDQLDDIVNAYTQAGGGKGRIGGVLAGLSGAVGVNPTARAYNQTLQESAEALAPALIGINRQANAQDLAAIVQSLPQLNDTPAEAALKVKKLKGEIAARRTAFQNAPLTQDSSLSTSDISSGQ